MDDISAGPARYDQGVESWLLSSFSDVAAALREPLLSPSDPGPSQRHTSPSIPNPEHARAGGVLAAWRTVAERSAAATAAALAADRTIDLVRDVAAPWALSLALHRPHESDLSEVTRPGDAAVAALAREVFLLAAYAESASVTTSQLDAVRALATALPRHTDDGSLTVQSFVALSQTLPCVLAGAWLALIHHPAELDRLRAEPERTPRAVEELLRFAGPSRAVFRVARGDVAIGDARIESGQRITLFLAAANRDPARFSEPDRLDLGRDATGHLAFGRGEHSCVGASIIRSAVGIATAALLAVGTSIELAGDVEWLDGYAIRAPQSLPVRLTRS